MLILKQIIIAIQNWAITNSSNAWNENGVVTRLALVQSLCNGMGKDEYSLQNACFQCARDR